MAEEEVLHSGKLEFGDTIHTLELIAVKEIPIHEALAEFIINAIEAEASRVALTLYNAGTNPFLAIRDNGLGMSHQRLDEVAKKISDSIKRGKEGFHGRHGVGLFTACVRLAARTIHIISKNPEQAETCTLITILTGKKPDFKVIRETQRSIRGQGTHLILYGIPPRERKALAAMMAVGRSGQSRLVQKLGIAFRNQISKKTLEILLERRGGRGSSDEYVHPVGFGGAPVHIDDIEVPHVGRVSFNLYSKTSQARGGAIAIQYPHGPVVSDLAGEYKEFNGAPWTEYEGEIYVPTTVERGATGLKTNHRTVLAFFHALRRIEPTLREFRRQMVEEKMDLGEANTLRDAFKEALGSDALTLERFSKMPKPHVITPPGEGREMVLERASLDGHRGPRVTVGNGTSVRQPYAVPPPGKSPFVTGRQPVPKPAQKTVLARRVSSLVWQMGLFREEERGLLYKDVEGVVHVNTGYDGYLLFIDTGHYQGHRVTKSSLKLLWVGMVTCQLLVDLNMEPEKGYTARERENALRMLIGKVSALLLTGVTKGRGRD